MNRLDIEKYAYRCPQCGRVINLKEKFGILRGSCRACRLKIRLLKSDFEEWAEKNK